MVGSAIERRLRAAGQTNILQRTSQELDLRNQAAVQAFFAAERPDYVYLTAAKVGGILANATYPASFLYDNLLIEANIIEAARLSGVKKLLFLGSSCIYPKLAPQPMGEDALLTGSLEPTNEAYAIAKIAGLKLCDAYRQQYGCNFISAMPTNLYGSYDNYDLQSSHVLPALIRKIHEAKKNKSPEVVLWGTGSPRREFLHVDDLADACVFLMEQHNEAGWVNVGTGTDCSILELAQLIQKIIGYKGEIVHDLSKPDGTPRKLLDVRKLSQLGWQYKIPLEAGIQKVYASLEKEPWF